MTLETNYTKAQLAEKIRELTDKLKEMRKVETTVNASVEDLKLPAASLTCKPDGTYQFVKLVYDLDKNAAAIVSVEDLGKDQAVALYKLQQYNVEQVFMKARGGKYV